MPVKMGTMRNENRRWLCFDLPFWLGLQHKYREERTNFYYTTKNKQLYLLFYHSIHYNTFR